MKKNIKKVNKKSPLGKIELSQSDWNSQGRSAEQRVVKNTRWEDKEWGELCAPKWN